MDNVDIDLVRVLLKQLCGAPGDDGGGVSRRAVFDFGAAPGYEDRQAVRAHHELLVARGIARIGRINSINPPDLAVLELSESGRTWGRHAHDDRQWEQHAGALRALLTA